MKLKNPSLPYILVTGAVLVAVLLHDSWHLSTPRERASVVATVGRVESVRVRGTMTARVGARRAAQWLGKVVGR